MDKNIYTKGAAFICIGLLFFSIYKIWSVTNDRAYNRELYASIREDINQPTNVEIGGEIRKEEKKQMVEWFRPLMEKNEETVGWITVPNTKIDYPIVKAKNNDFYLTHNFEKRRSDAGAIFMDYRNTGEGSDRHTIIYGHHMRDGSMFKTLVQYKNQAFFEENPVLTLHTLYEETKWEVFSAYVTNTNFYYIVTDFRSNRDYLDFLKEVQKKSLFPKEVNFTEKDQLLTLSTCTYEMDDARFVVHARLVEEK